MPKLKDFCLPYVLFYAIPRVIGFIVTDFNNEGSVLSFDPAYWFLLSFSGEFFLFRYSARYSFASLVRHYLIYLLSISF